MIFITVGAQLPFDRLIESVLVWHGLNPSVEICWQLGESQLLNTIRGSVSEMDKLNFHDTLSRSSLVVSHCGMGTILDCLGLNKPLICMPRRFKFGETRNDHQVDTAKRVKSDHVLVAQNPGEVPGLIDFAIEKEFVFQNPESSSNKEFLINLSNLARQLTRTK